MSHPDGWWHDSMQSLHGTEILVPDWVVNDISLLVGYETHKRDWLAQLTPERDSINTVGT